MSQCRTIEEASIDWYQMRDGIEIREVDNVCVRALNLIFNVYKRIRKLTVSDDEKFLSRECHSVKILQLWPNLNIKELHLLIPNTLTSKLVLETLLAACPNLQHLYLNELDQGILRTCAQKLKHLESISAKSFKLLNLPDQDIHFEKLKKVDFVTCSIKNQPRVNKMKALKKKIVVLDMLT